MCNLTSLLIKLRELVIMMKLKNYIEDHLNTLNINAHSYIIRKLINHHCGNSVVTSGENTKNNNCFWVGFKKNDITYLGFESFDQNHFVCKKYINNQYAGEDSVDPSELKNLNIEITYYYKHHQMNGYGIYRFIFAFLCFRLAIPFINFFDQLSQLFFNQRSLSSKKRYEFLKLLVANFTGYKGGFSYVEVMSSIHSIKVFVHPDFNKEASRMQALLSGLVDTGELKPSHGNYELTGHAFKALDDYEEEDRRHRSMNLAQWVLIFVTTGLLFATLMQAGVIKIPNLIDFTK